MIISVFPWGTSSEVIPTIPDTDFSGDYETVMDADGGWRMRILSSGTLTFTGQKYVDIFAVGGGGGGQPGLYQQDGLDYTQYGGGGGGGGETVTESGVTLIAGHTYNIIIGAGGAVGSNGGDTSMDSLIIAHGGGTGVGPRGGDGASGGGCGSLRETRVINEYDAGAGGSDGSDGYGHTGGDGSGTTTREFGETTGDLYAGGGGGGNNRTRTQYYGGSGGGGNGACYDSLGNRIYATAGYANTGGGGGGGREDLPAAPGGSGILIIRNHRE